MKYYDIENTEQRTILSELLCEYDPRYADEPIRNNLVIKLASKTVIDDLYELETFIIFHKSSISIMKHFANTETKNVVNLTTILKDFDTIETFMSDMTEESLLHVSNEDLIMLICAGSIGMPWTNIQFSDIQGLSDKKKGE